MQNPLISIVIPTRDRPDTLEVCLRALRRETSRRIEIVVQDNFSDPRTVEVVRAAQAADDRIRYSRADHSTSQRQSFEYALAASRGDYMSIIGDDDGFTTGSLDWLAQRLEGSDIDAVRWNLLHYVWPSLSQDGEGFMDVFASQCNGGSRTELGAGLADDVIRARTMGSWANILVYHGMISRRVYDCMRAKTGGTFFAYPMPDVYAHNLIPFFCNTYLQVDDIVSIYGTSGHSAGASWTRVTNGGNDETASAARRWMAESNDDALAAKLAWQPAIRTLRYHDYCVFKIAQQYDMLGGRTLNDKVWIDAIVREIRMSPHQLAHWLTAEPKADHDKVIFDRVKRLATSTRGAARPQTNKKAADPRIPSLRIKAISPDLPDDVEGAGLALAQLTGGAATRFEVSSEQGSKQRGVKGVLRAAVASVHRRVPVLSSQVLNNRLLPSPLWRRLKGALNVRPPGYQDLHLRIASTMEAYGTKKAAPTELERLHLNQ